MFYLSKQEQVALWVLIALLLSGAGVLTYQHGLQAGRARAPEQFFTEAPAAAPVAATAPDREAAPAPSPQPYEPAPATPVAPPAHSQTARPGKTAGSGLLSLNRASAEELEVLPGIGPVLAGRIVQYRERRKKETGSGFASVDELLNVSGIGPKRLAALRGRVAL